MIADIFLIRVSGNVWLRTKAAAPKAYITLWVVEAICLDEEQEWRCWFLLEGGTGHENLMILIVIFGNSENFPAVGTVFSPPEIVSKGDQCLFLTPP